MSIFEHNIHTTECPERSRRFACPLNAPPPPLNPFTVQNQTTTPPRPPFATVKYNQTKKNPSTHTRALARSVPSQCTVRFARTQSYNRVRARSLAGCALIRNRAGPNGARVTLAQRAVTLSPPAADSWPHECQRQRRQRLTAHARTRTRNAHQSQLLRNTAHKTMT